MLFSVNSWEHANCIREVDRIPEDLHAMLCVHRVIPYGPCTQFVMERALSNSEIAGTRN